MAGHRHRLVQLGRQPAQRRHRRSCAPTTVDGGRRGRPSTRRGAGERIRAVGSGHSFTAIAVADGDRLDLSDLDTERPASTGRADWSPCPPASPLRALNALLAGHGLAMPNLGDIDAQTIAGAISTGTHGTGAAYGCLSTFVEALTLVTGTGEVLRCSADEHPESSPPPGSALGALGVLVEVTLRCVDAFTLRADERPAGARRGAGRPATTLVGGHDHVEFYWFPYTDRVQLKTNNRVPADDRPLPRLARLAGRRLPRQHRLRRGLPARPGRARRWPRRISAVSARALTARTYTGRSDLVFCTPRRVRFVEMEYGAAPRRPARGARRAAAHRRRAAVQGARSRSRCGSPPPTTSGCPTATAATPRTSPMHQYVGMPYEPYFRAFEAGRQRAGRPPALGQAALPRRGVAGDRLPAVRRLPGASATRSDPDRASSPTPTYAILGPSRPLFADSWPTPAPLLRAASSKHPGTLPTGPDAVLEGTAPLGAVLQDRRAIACRPGHPAGVLPARVGGPARATGRLDSRSGGRRQSRPGARSALSSSARPASRGVASEDTSSTGSFCRRCRPRRAGSSCPPSTRAPATGSLELTAGPAGRLLGAPAAWQAGGRTAGGSRTRSRVGAGARRRRSRRSARGGVPGARAASS